MPARTGRQFLDGLKTTRVLYVGGERASIHTSSIN
jgi:hypothetical protein